jgi:predicted TIM-barrel fold metal-dependent hydrolase
MGDFELQQETCAKAGITGRIISTPFAAEVMAAISKSASLDICKAVNDGIAGIVARAPGNWGMGTLNPLDKNHIAEGERCLAALKFKGLLICSSWHGRFIDGEDSFAFWEWAQDRQVPVFHPPAARADRQ